jgi:Uma2 family endonuclease
MRTVVVGELPVEIDTFLARRRALGQDLYDEMWDGEYHVVPAAHPWHGYVDRVLAELLGPPARAAGLVGTGPFNLGDPDDYRVPDGGYHRALPSTVFVPTAAIVVEIVSPGDESWEKFGFYAAHGVEELALADPRESRLRWFELADGAFAETDRSRLLDLTVHDMDAAIDWPG